MTREAIGTRTSGPPYGRQRRRRGGGGQAAAGRHPRHLPSMPLAGWLVQIPVARSGSSELNSAILDPFCEANAVPLPKVGPDSNLDSPPPFMPLARAWVSHKGRFRVREYLVCRGV